ncbi:hypothetical protein CDD83_2469 [Cordyceps sp. RAO-2017]|nr:hypothetical protein CDD83_2469 [Cordyceps sp. RAO-2017]
MDKETQPARDGQRRLTDTPALARQQGRVRDRRGAGQQQQAEETEEEERLGHGACLPARTRSPRLAGQGQGLENDVEGRVGAPSVAGLVERDI